MSLPIENFEAGLPLSPAPSPIPSIRRLHLHQRTPSHGDSESAEHDVLTSFHSLSSDSQSRVLRQLLQEASRDTLLEVKRVISPRLRHDPFRVLPLEISLRILSYISDPQSLAAAAQVSRLWYFLLSDDSTWKQMCHDHHFRRLSAAGSYVHQWTELRGRAPSQVLEETPETEFDDRESEVSTIVTANVADSSNQGSQISVGVTRGHSTEASNSDNSAGQRSNSVHPGQATPGQGAGTGSGSRSRSGSGVSGVSGIPGSRTSSEFHYNNTSQFRRSSDMRHSARRNSLLNQLTLSPSHRSISSVPPARTHEQDSGSSRETNSNSSRYGSLSDDAHMEDFANSPSTSYERTSTRESMDYPDERPYHGGPRIRDDIDSEVENDNTSPHPAYTVDGAHNGEFSNDLFHQYATAHNNTTLPNMPLMHYGARLPNPNSEMEQNLSAGVMSEDPIGEAYYDPEACVTNPPDSYRSHFRQQYLLNQAWTNYGILAARYSLPEHEAAIVTTVLMHDGYIVVALDTSLVLVFNDDGKLLRSLYGHVMGVWALALHEHTLVSGGCDRDVREWDLQTGVCRKILRGHSSTVRCLAMVSSHLALSGGRDGVIRVWDLKDGRSLHRLASHTASVRRLEVFEIDGVDLAVSASYDCTAKIWNVKTGELLHTLAGHSNQIYSLAIDGGRIATGSLDHTICVWDIRTGANLGMLAGHAALVGQLAMRKDTLVSGGSDGSVRIWDLQKMTCLYRIAAHDHTVTCLRLTDDRIITGGPDCKVHVWNARTGEHVRQLQKPSVSTVWGVSALDDRLLTVYSEGSSVIVELVSFIPK